MSGDSKCAKRQSVVVTGGASGLGLAMTQHFASRGHRITVVDVNVDSGLTAVSEVSAQYPQATLSFKKCDVSSWQEQATVFKEIYQEHGAIDIVMANAGISEQGATSLALTDEEEPSQPRLKVLDINLTGTIYSVKLAMHYMRKNAANPSTGSRGSIICTASNAGLYPFPVAPLYSASKGGVIMLVRSVAKILESVNIQINALAPAVLESNIAPKDLFKDMKITPTSTLIKGVKKILENPDISGTVAEIHGEEPTIRPHHEYVDDDTKANLENFWSLGFA
ncbi:15-hydroxyprostaglandin dehydrogenase [Whalleya microplaca]|nr:15-hydroxyprostaglandin dehydrogenase [Whalleya microplaca]